MNIKNLEINMRLMVIYNIYGRDGRFTKTNKSNRYGRGYCGGRKDVGGGDEYGGEPKFVRREASF